MLRRIALVLVLALACGAGVAVGCGDSAPAHDGAPDAARDAATDRAVDMPRSDAGVDAPVELTAVAKAPAYAVVGATLTLDGSQSSGAVAYRWFFGNGDGWSEARPQSDATVTYDKPGRYAAVLEVFDGDGAKRTASVSVAVTFAPTHTMRHSTTVTRIFGTPERVAVVSPDSDELMIAERGGTKSAPTFKVLRRIKTAARPRTVAAVGRWLAIACQKDARLELHSIDTPAVKLALTLPRASRPYGVIATADKRLLVTLQGTGQLAEIAFDGSATTPAAPTLIKLHDAVVDARALALLPDGRVAVTRWRSPADRHPAVAARGEVVVIDPSSNSSNKATWPLAFDPQKPSDTEIGGVPSYLGQIVVSPDGRDIVLPSLQADIGHGSFRSGIALREDTTVRAVLSFIELPAGKENAARRFQFDGRGLAYAAAYSSRGDYLYVVTRGAQAIERIDALSGAQSGTIFGAGYAPEGVVVSGDDRYIYVNAYMARELVVYDVSDLSTVPPAAARLSIPSAEPLSAQLLRGKQLFSDSADPRITKDRYIACAHCHLEGESDNLVWDFSDRGEGLRNTISLLGRAGAGDGPIHWSGNFDEIHDFEHDIRGPFGGAGLMRDTDFNSGTRNTTLGDKKAGISADLDALAAYVTSLDQHHQSPARQSDGSLTAQAQAGKALFESAALGCTTCHGGARLTDSKFTAPGAPLLHDVGTLGAASGKRLGAALSGIDTPTLHGLWSSAPYLHDGSAPTLRAVLTTKNVQDKHGVTSGLSATQLDQLIAYLRSLDGRRD